MERNRRWHRLLSLVLCICLVLSAMPITARAVGQTEYTVASVTIGDTVEYYIDLNDAIQAVNDCTAEDEAVVTFLKDIDLGDSSQTIDVGVFSVDLNGFEIRSTHGSDGALRIIGSAASVTVLDSGESGKVVGNAVGIDVSDGASLNVLGGTISGRNGVHANGSTVTVSGGEIDGTENGLYSINATVNVCGGKINGNSGVCVDEGNVVISGGEIRGSSEAVCSQYHSAVLISGGSIFGEEYHVSCSFGGSAILGLGESGVGATFPDGIRVYGTMLNAILGEGVAYWQGDKQLDPYAGATKISGGVRIAPTAGVVAFVSKNGAFTGAYTTLDDAIQTVAFGAEEDNAVVKLLADIELDETQFVTSGVFTLDLNGFDISTYELCYPEDDPVAAAHSISAFYLAGPNVDMTLVDSGIGGSIHSAGPCIEARTATFTMEGGKLYALENCVRAYDSSTISISGGSLDCDDKCVSVENSCELYINGGSVIGRNYGVYCDSSTVTVSGGDISGERTLEAYDSTVTITGGNIIFGEEGINECLGIVAKGCNVSITGGSITGLGIGIDATDCALSISGGTITSTATAVSVYADSRVSITGGDFSNSIVHLSKNGETVFTLGVGENGVGATFGRLVVSGMSLNSILEEGAGYWVGNGFVTPTDEDTEIGREVTVMDVRLHQWVDATCTTPKTCFVCGLTEGKPLGHQLRFGTCTRCRFSTYNTYYAVGDEGLFGVAWDSACSENKLKLDEKTGFYSKVYENVPAGSYQFLIVSNAIDTPSYNLDGICDSDSPNAVVKVSEDGSTVVIGFDGEKATIKIYECNHDWKDATCTIPKTCSKCSVTEGNPLGHQLGLGICTRCRFDTRLTSYYVEGDEGLFGVAGNSSDKSLHLIDRTGFFITEFENVRAGSYQFLIVANGKDTSSYNLDGICDSDSPKAEVEVLEDGSLVVIGFDGEKATLEIYAPGECYHNWKDATCTAPVTCSFCGFTKGDALGHQLQSGICTHCGFDARDTYYAEGDEGLFGVAWDSACSQNMLELDEKTGFYSKVYENVPAGSYQFLIVSNGKETPSYNLDGICSSDSPKAEAKVTKDGSLVVIGFDGEKATLEIYAPGECYHNWKDATCTAPETCTRCGETKAHVGETILGYGATCTEDGLADGIKCLVCGETQQEVITAYGHVDADNTGLCDTCGELMQPAKLAMATISLKGNIAINYYALLSDEVLADSTAYMKFTMADGSVIRIPVSEGVKKVMNEETYYMFSCAVNAKEMTDQVIGQIFYNGGSTKAQSYSIQEYAKHVLESSDDSELKALVQAMLNYGGASQRYFNHNTDNLANAGLETPDYTDVTIDGFTIPSGQGTEQVKFQTTSLILKSETTLRFFFTGKITASYNGQDLEVKEQNGLYYVDVVGITAKDLGSDVTITISDGMNTADVTYNPMAYCAIVLKDTTGIFNQEVKNAVAALYLYYQAAMAYFGN